MNTKSKLIAIIVGALSRVSIPTCGPTIMFPSSSAGSNSERLAQLPTSDQPMSTGITVTSSAPSITP